MFGFGSNAIQSNFELVVRTAQGGVQTLELSAADANAASALATRDGMQVLTCIAHGPSEVRAGSEQSAARLGIDIANFSYELSSLLIAGLSVIEALRTLAAKEVHRQARNAILNIVSGIDEGLPLSAAMQRPPGRFPPLLIATVSASEQTGDLSSALSRYAEHQMMIKALRDKVVGATVYPVLLLAIGCLVVMFLMTVVIPKFAVLIESTHHELPWSSQLLMTWGRFAAAHAWQIGALGALGVIALIVTGRHIVRSGAKATWLDKIPFVGPTMRQFRHAQLYRTTGMLVRGGTAAPKALELAATLLGDADRIRLNRAIVLIHEGRSLNHSLESAQLADPVATSMLAVAERTGALPDILERIADFHESRLKRSVEITSRLFEPLLMISIGLVVGAIVVMMYLPIFDLASSLQ
jgi:general secretion pathway protein F